MADDIKSDAQSQDVAGAGAQDNGGQTPTPTPDVSGGTPPTGDKPWYGDMPETAHEALKGFESLDEAVAAAQRGKDYTPAKDVSEYSLSFGEGTAEPDDVVNGYKKVCLDNGVTPKAAQTLIDFQYDLIKSNHDKAMKEGTEALKEAWGSKYEANCEQGLIAMQAIDRKMDGKLLPAMEKAGLKLDPTVSEMFYHLSTLIGEDSLGSGGPGGSLRAETRDEAYDRLFAKKE